MSWLLVAFVPGLLMLGTFGLDRLEAGLNRDTLTASDVAEFLERAEAADMSALARTGLAEALDRLHRRRANRFAEATERRSGNAWHRAGPLFPAGDEQGLPTPRRGHSRANR